MTPMLRPTDEVIYTAYEVFDGQAQSSHRKTGIIRVK